MEPPLGEEDPLASIDEQVEFLKSQRAFHEKKAASKRIEPSRADTHLRLATKFTEVIQSLEALPQRDEAPVSDASVEDLFAIDRYDLSSLPDSLVEELSISRADEDDTQIIQLFRIARRPLSINEIMVGLYRKFGVQHKRSSLNSRLYRMANKGDLASVGKGLYDLPTESTPDLFMEEPDA